MDPFRDMPPNPFGQVVFPAEVTAVTDADSGSGSAPRYAWRELRVAADGSLVEMEGGRRGTAARDAAREINDRTVAVPTNVWMRLRGGGRDGNLVYEFVDPTGGGGAGSSCTITFVSAICRGSLNSGSGGSG